MEFIKKYHEKMRDKEKTPKMPFERPFVRGKRGRDSAEKH